MNGLSPPSGPLPTPLPVCPGGSCRFAGYEIRQSEMLAEAGVYRLFVKAQAICELGSVFVAVISPGPTTQP